MTSSVVLGPYKPVDASFEVESSSKAKTLRTYIFEFFDIPYTEFRRKYPKIGMKDTRGGFRKPDHTKLENLLKSFPPNITVQTLFPELGKLSTLDAHGYANSFEDKEIVKVYPMIHSTQITQEHRSINVYYTENKKPIIQQQSTRGCTAAATGMLILEHEKPLDLFKLSRRNLGIKEKQMQDLKEAGLKPLLSYCKNIADLQVCLKKQGSAIVSVDSGAGSHAVLLDAINKFFVRIRDPYHGWEVEIALEAFLNSWDPLSPIIQV